MKASAVERIWLWPTSETNGMFGVQARSPLNIENVVFFSLDSGGLAGQLMPNPGERLAVDANPRREKNRERARARASDRGRAKEKDREGERERGRAKERKRERERERAKKRDREGERER